MVFSYLQFGHKSPDEMRKKRLEKIKQQVEYVHNNSPWYRALFKEQGVRPEDIRSYDDFSKIPVVTKDDIRRQNRDFFAAPEEEWVDITTTSGTTGQPTYMPLTRGDLYRVSVCGAQTAALSGLSSLDTMHLTLPMSAWMWMAGYGFYLMFTTIGATVLRFGPGFTEKSMSTLKSLKATALMATPSFALKLGKDIADAGIRHNVNKIYTIGENVLEKNLSHNELGAKIEKVWGAELFACYGATEGPFVSVECKRHNGHHINPLEVYVEILDPQTHKPLPHGKEGLVCITPLGSEGFPLLRYVNGDISFLVEGLCPCGKMLDRIGPIMGRMDHMMKIKGVMIYPEALKQEIHRLDIVETFQIEAFTRNYADGIRINLPAGVTPETGGILVEKLKRKFGVTFETAFFEDAVLKEMVFPQGSRKPRDFVDKR